MITEKDYRYIVDDVYAVDSHKVKVPLKEGAVVAQGKFRIITAPVDNTANGMQAMAVAPVDKNGNVDHSHVVISYAGTNSSDIKDLGTDVQSLGLGRDKLQSRSGLNSAKVVDSQFVTALNYADVN
ncbi:hypothetical protein I6L85_10350 [Streptococcus gordonii]|jgi:hypothetical protein|uniref:hypothetical protein n=1 Tax=Streptococcus TaxID=1301 RepID=UPI0001BB557C|nr:MULTISPECIES: hypothetical protein [Streptococcus]EEY80846.1 hypothetical protein HMPREF0847_00066 [Streptococcus sp. 2_1_36FAA]MBZ2124144.1 hypothetical protein [Streptococcus gordonii]MCB6583121.1 hypothetical protein [Streptococcus gordonii]MCB7053859.1 hypothetical protein [Streptococcus gordonii]MCB7055946.1 hypothetical protein [Streptococcus gordonii]